MNYYQEITLLPDVDISLGFLWQNVFQQVHIALVEHKVDANQSSVAVGFPDYLRAKFPWAVNCASLPKNKRHWKS